jgi:multidrug efflux pump subunit AcrA (membrane-fusion protein)
MPPIPQQGSRAGLITALVIFAILFVTATIFAFIYNARATRADLDLDNLRKKYNTVVAEGALTSPEVTTLRDAGGGDTVVNVAMAQTRQLAALLGGRDVATATQVARKALDGARESVKKFGIALGNDTSSAVTALAQAVVAREAQIAQLTADRDANAKQVAAAKAQQEAQVAAHTAALEEARAAAAQATANATSTLGSKDEQVAQIEKERADERAKAAADAEALRAQMTERDGAIKQKDDEINRLRQKLGATRGNVTTAVMTQADGQIIRLPGNDIAYIDLGAGEQIAPGMTFEVYDKSDGVPPPATPDSTDLPAGKASLEVLRVGATSAECRITRTAPGAQLTEGDLIANLVYDRNTKFTFFVFGNFDLDGNGVATAGDANVIKQLVTQWGGRVADKIDVSTDFAVLGPEPVVPTFTDEEKADPINAKKLEDAEAALKAYDEVVQRAGELNIPVLNQNRFLYYVGYFEQAKR